MPPKKSATSKVKKVDDKPSVVSAFGGVADPLAIFIEEAEVPTPPPKKSRKPPVVAVVTPDGIQGSLHQMEQRPLVAHLPIHKSDIDSDLFCEMKAQDSGPVSSVPTPYDPADVFSQFSTSNDVILMKEQPVEAKPAPAASRGSLPLHYSEKLMIRYQDANRDQKLPEGTDVACFWDCHPFRGPPCALSLIHISEPTRPY